MAGDAGSTVIITVDQQAGRRQVAVRQRVCAWHTVAATAIFNGAAWFGARLHQFHNNLL